MRIRKTTTKLLALILSLLMLFTMIPLSVSAENTTPTTIIDHAELDADGVYHLTDNVTVTATYEEKFTGKLNGNGYIVTTSVPLFKTVSGATIENLTIVGEVTGYAAVASLVTGDNKTTFKDIANQASVSNNANLTAGGWEGVTSAYVPAAGFAAFVFNTQIDIISCINSGAITATASGGTTSPAGAMIGYASSSTSGTTVNIEDCNNTGAVSANKMAAGMIAMLNNTTATVTNCGNSGTITSETTYAGGIVAYKQGSGVVSIKNCTNANTVTGTGYVGGIVGYAKGASPLTVVSCGNTKNVTATSKPASDGSYVAGIIGFSDATVSALTVKYCYNTGDISSPSGRCAAGIVGRMSYLSDSSTQSIVEGCYNSGTITGAEAHTAQIFWSTTTANKRFIGTNFYLADSEAHLVAYTANGITYNTIGDTDKSDSFTSDELASGALAKTINDTVGETVYYQNINEDGATKDKYPVTDPTHGYVFENGGKLYSLAFFTLKTASIRLDEVNHGIRFSTAVNKADYAVLKNAGIELTFGTLITPDDYLEVAGYDFTKDKLDKLKFDSSNAKAYLDVTPKGDGIAVFKELKGQDNENYYYFCGSISEIKTANYGWDYSAIGYVKIDNKEVYSGGYATRNISFIANAAYNDRQAEKAGLYTNAIAADSEYAINGVASYSPYTTDELRIIGRYLPQA